MLEAGDPIIPENTQKNLSCRILDSHRGYVEFVDQAEVSFYLSDGLYGQKLRCALSEFAANFLVNTLLTRNLAYKKSGHNAKRCPDDLMHC